MTAQSRLLCQAAGLIEGECPFHGPRSVDATDVVTKERSHADPSQKVCSATADEIMHQHVVGFCCRSSKESTRVIALEVVQEE